MTSSGQPRSRKRFSRLRAGKKFAGGKAAKDGWSPAFGRVACRPPMDFMKVVALANSSGYLWNGRRRPLSRPSISSATYLPTTAFGASYKSPNRAGKSSRIMVQSEFLLELLIILLDFPARFGDLYEAPKAVVGR